MTKPIPFNAKSPLDDVSPLSHLHPVHDPDRNETSPHRQLLLHPLPLPILSLLVYLLAFFSQVALVREEDGVGGVDDLSRMFGGRILGGGNSSSNSTGGNVANSRMEDMILNTTRTRREGEVMMAWFLRRWALLSEGFFDVIDDHISASGRQTRQSENATEEECLRDDLFEEGMFENVEHHNVHSTAPACGNPDEFCTGTMLPRIRINGRSPVHFTPQSSTRGKGWRSKSFSPDGRGCLRRK